MSVSTLKALSIVVGICVAGVVVSFGLGLYTALQEEEARENPAPLTIPTPAMAQ